MVTEQERQSNQYTLSKLSDPQTPNPHFGPVIIAARHPGAANCLGLLAKFLHEKNIPIFFQGTEVGEEKLKQQFPGKEEVGELPKTASWILISADDPTLFELKAIEKARSNNPNIKIGVAEDFPGSISQLIDDLTLNHTYPDLILTTTRSQANKYTSNERLGKTLVVPVGQPSFDALLSEQTKEVAITARTKLGIPPDAMVVTYIGIPAGDDEKPDTFSDLNSLTLELVNKSMKEIATKYPDRKFYLINRPHPREKPALWDHPLLHDNDNKPSNLTVISHSKKDWTVQGLTTREICTASNLVTTTHSTVGQETALSGARPNKNTNLGSVALHVLLPGFHEELRTPGNFLIVDVGATGVAREESEVTPEMEKCLFDPNYQQQIHEGEKKLGDQYRFKSSATRRIYHWLRFVNRFENNSKIALQEFIKQLTIAIKK